MGIALEVSLSDVRLIVQLVADGFSQADAEAALRMSKSDEDVFEYRVDALLETHCDATEEGDDGVDVVEMISSLYPRGDLSLFVADYAKYVENVDVARVFERQPTPSPRVCSSHTCSTTTLSATNDSLPCQFISSDCSRICCSPQRGCG